MTEHAPDVIDWIGGGISACQSAVRNRGLPSLARFATEALASCCDAVSSPPEEVVAVIHAGQQHWALGHKAFDAVRDLTIEAERDGREQESPRLALLYVAENAARVIYNASCPDDPFDEDSGAWLLYSIVQFLQCMEAAPREQLTSIVLRVYSSC